MGIFSFLVQRSEEYGNSSSGIGNWFGGHHTYWTRKNRQDRPGGFSKVCSANTTSRLHGTRSCSRPSRRWRKTRSS